MLVFDSIRHPISVALGGCEGPERLSSLQGLATASRDRIEGVNEKASRKGWQDPRVERTLAGTCRRGS